MSSISFTTSAYCDTGPWYPYHHKDQCVDGLISTRNKAAIAALFIVPGSYNMCNCTCFISRWGSPSCMNNLLFFSLSRQLMLQIKAKRTPHNSFCVTCYLTLWIFFFYVIEMNLRNKHIGQIKTAFASHGFLQKHPTAHVTIIVNSRDIHMSLSISQRRMSGIPWISYG